MLFLITLAVLALVIGSFWLGFWLGRRHARYAGMKLKIWSGSGAGQEYLIVDNDRDSLTVVKPFSSE